jgi:phosphoribosylformimino-5-aminoimidazole carboxamide ribotide isomerase
VDVLDGKVVRLYQGSFEQVTSFASDPVEVAGRWVAEGADLVHVVDLEGARRGTADPSLWHRLSERRVSFQVGGGIRRADLAREALAAGAARVVMGSAAVWHPAELSAVGDPDRVVAALDVSGGTARGEGWAGQGRPFRAVLAAVKEAGIRRVLVTGISRDGTLLGPDWSLLDQVKAEDPDLAIIASGGVGSLADVRGLAEAGYEAAIIGRALYEGRFSLKQAIEVVRGVTGS